MVMGELEQETRLLVIGGGPGGYAGAFRAADLGLEVTLVDRDPRPGGVCLHRGCIPSKTLLFLTELIHDAGRADQMGVHFGTPRIDLEALRRWKAKVVDGMAQGLENLCRRRGVQLIQAQAQFESSTAVRLQGGDVRRIRFQHAIVATGSRSIPFGETPFLPAGRIMSSSGALALADVPPSLLVVGGGYVGLELGMVYGALGSRVILLEHGDRLLPGVDPDLVAPLRQRLETVFADIRLNARVMEMEESGGKVTVTLAHEGQTRRVDADRVLVAIGRRPASRNLGLANTGVQVDPRGFIRTDDRQRTDDPAILAVGDVTGSPMLAHKAARQGKVAAETAAGRTSAFDVQAIPAVVYTDPQIAWCGWSEEEARQAGKAVAVRRFPWKYSGRAATMGTTEGLTKLIIDPRNGRILGAGMVGRHAESLIAEAVLAIEMGALAEDLALTLHPHPTLSETESEAAELFLGNATHLAAAMRG